MTTCGFSSQDRAKLSIMASEIVRQTIRLNHLTRAIADLEIQMTAIADLRTSILNAIGKINAQASQIGAMGNHITELMTERGALSAQLDAANAQIAGLVASGEPTEVVSDLELADLANQLNAAVNPVAAPLEPPPPATEPAPVAGDPVVTPAVVVVDGKNPNS